MSAWKKAKAYGVKQLRMFSAEVGALGREGLNDARNIFMDNWGSGEKTPGTIGYPTSQEVTDSFGGTYEQRMQQAKEGKAKEEQKAKEEPKGKEEQKGKEEPKDKSKGREMDD